MRLQDRVVIITGGGRGIGAATAQAIAGDGGKVVIGDMLEAEGEATAASIRAAGGDAVFVRTDITKEADCVRLAATAAAVRAAPVKKRKVKRKVVAMRRRGGAFFSGSRGRRRSTCTRRGPSGSPRLVGQKTSPSSSSPASVSSVPWSRPGCVARPDRSSSSRLRAGPRLFLIYGSPSFKSAPRSRSARIAICSQPRWDFHTMQSRKPLTVPPMR